MATDCTVGKCVGSDHMPVVLRLNNYANIKNVPVKKTRLIGKTNWQKYTTEILNHIPNDIESQNININTIDSQIHDIENVMISAFHKACPEKPMRPLASTLNKETVALIKHKRKLRRLCQRNPQDAELKTAYYSLKRQVAKAIKQDRQSQWEQATASLNGIRDGKIFWNTFKRLTGTGKANQKQIRIAKPNGEITSNEQEVADTFASNLRDIHNPHTGAMFNSTFKLTVDSAMKAMEKDFEPQLTPKAEEGDDHATLEPITLVEIKLMLKKLKLKSCPGEDGLSYQIIKNTPDPLLEKISQVYNMCLNTGYYPKNWKSAVGTMIPKPGKDPTNVSNYRPISLLKCIGKVFEKIISNRLYSGPYGG